MDHPALELTDRDNDAVTLHLDSSGVWISCTNANGEITVGPLRGSDLATWLSSVLAVRPAV